MHMWMRSKKNRKPMIDHRGMWRTEGMFGLTWELVMMMSMSASMAMMWMPMRRNKHRKPMMNQPRMWRTKGIVLESAQIELYISDL